MITPQMRALTREPVFRNGVDSIAAAEAMV